MNLCSDPPIPNVEIESVSVVIDFSLIDDVFLNALLKNAVEGLECNIIDAIGMLE